MATTIYVASTEKLSGKTGLCIGLMRWLQRKGLKVGYMKPVSSAARAIDGRMIDEDVPLSAASPFRSSGIDAPRADDPGRGKSGCGRRGYGPLRNQGGRGVSQHRKGKDAVVLKAGPTCGKAVR